MIFNIIDCVATNIVPDKDSMKIQFEAIINGSPAKFDPFVSSHLEWWEAHIYAKKKVKFKGWLHSGNCWLVQEIISVDDE
jgi:hypothetical protein